MKHSIETTTIAASIEDRDYLKALAKDNMVSIQAALHQMIQIHKGKAAFAPLKNDSVSPSMTKEQYQTLKALLEESSKKQDTIIAILKRHEEQYFIPIKEATENADKGLETLFSMLNIPLELHIDNKD